MTDTMIIAAVSIIALTALVTFFVSRSILVSKFKMERARYDSNINLLQQRLSDADRHHEKAVMLLNEGHEKAMSELKAAHNQALHQQLETLKAQMTAETEKLLKAREDELDRKAKETFGHIAEGLDKDIRSMKEAFDSNRKSSAESSQSLKDNIENAVKTLREQTQSIGDKADSLADALKGRNKAQGNWGEVILDNLFVAEGLKEGRDYDKEETLRDEFGNILRNEDTEKRMRPDFILH